MKLWYYQIEIRHQPIPAKSHQQPVRYAWKTKARREPRPTIHEVWQCRNDCEGRRAVWPSARLMSDLMNQLRHLGDRLDRALVPPGSQADDYSNCGDHYVNNRPFRLSIR